MKQNTSIENNVSLVYEPVIYRVGAGNKCVDLQELSTMLPGVRVFNEIHSQVEELVKCQYPQGLSAAELAVLVQKELGDDPDTYGCWVYYPWSNSVVHTLSPNDFITVRTNRNQNKITKQEQDTLATKCIGVVGLSVGQSISLTLAMERGCGEIRLADFDVLELSNLNRIRTPLYNLGVPKVIATAREIAEMDPFITVRVFTDGLTDDNLESFMLQHGTLDLLVDECDGIDMKIRMREFAKSHQIPVIMDTSDRGMLDIERFDIEPERPLLHGLVKNLNSAMLSGLTAEEKLPYIMQIVDYPNLSERAKSSLLEVKKTISTWPQLASSVVLGGGVGADVSRRILLNQLTVSGRFYVDLENIIKN
jgi:molybdopterin/thiamine biosynthesis adenylyltransferase